MTVKPTAGPGADVDVLVVGAGPVGLSAALLLDRLGLSVMIVDERGGPIRAPAAHVVNPRTFEIWRQLGLDVAALRALAQDPDDAGMVHWVTKLGGDVIGSLPFERQGADALTVTPTPLRNLSQHRVEPFLVDALAARSTEVLYEHRWCGMTSAARPDGVVSSLEHRGARHEVRSRCLLACDGASSPIRRSLGIVPEGPHHLQSFLMIHIAADFRQLVGKHKGALYWVCDTKAGGTFVSHGLDREWVYMLPVDHPDDYASIDTACADAIVRDALADPDVSFDVLTTTTWTMTAQVAPRFRHGNTFLVGDAAHRFPPTGGLGLNTGVQDAHNLAWKLAAVARGDCDDSLLDTYERERRPVAQRNADASLENALRMVEVPVALAGGDPALVQEAIEHQRPHFDQLELQLGYRYGVGSSPSRTSAAAQVGARVPHGWLHRDGRVISSLDLVPLDRFVTVAGPGAEHSHGALVVGRDFQDPHGWWHRAVGLPDDGVLVIRPDQHIANLGRLSS